MNTIAIDCNNLDYEGCVMLREREALEAIARGVSRSECVGRWIPLESLLPGTRQYHRSLRDAAKRITMFGVAADPADRLSVVERNGITVYRYQALSTWLWFSLNPVEPRPRSIERHAEKST